MAMTDVQAGLRWKPIAMWGLKGLLAAVPRLGANLGANPRARKKYLAAIPGHLPDLRVPPDVAAEVARNVPRSCFLECALRPENSANSA